MSLSPVGRIQHDTPERSLASWRTIGALRMRKRCRVSGLDVEIALRSICFASWLVKVSSLVRQTEVEEPAQGPHRGYQDLHRTSYPPTGRCRLLWLCLQIHFPDDQKM